VKSTVFGPLKHYDKAKINYDGKLFPRNDTVKLQTVTSRELSTATINTGKSSVSSNVTLHEQLMAPTSVWI